jgi:hypothetical protein
MKTLTGLLSCSALFCLRMEQVRVITALRKSR